MEKRLSSEKIIHLMKMHRKIKNRKDADKLKCIIYWGKGWSWEQIKEALFISDGSIKNYIDKYFEGGIDKLLSSNYAGHNYRLSKNEEKQLEWYVNRFCVLTTAQSCEYVRKTFKKNITISGMTKMLKRLGFVYKKPKKRPCKVSVEKQNDFLNKYFNLVENLKDDESIYFLDGSGFEHNSKMDYGWIKRGKNKEIKTNTGRKKINVNGAYNPMTKEVITIDYEENTTSKHNIELVKKIIKCSPNKRKITLILDNASMNKSKDFKDFIYNCDIEIILFFLPPYSPNLNLIERLWKYSKKKILSNRYYKTFLRFKTVLEDFFENKINFLKNELETLMTNNFQIFTVD